ncbi:MAG: putative toxin-antitoxin system toxin component, PIN family [Thermomicrobiales bacterium]|nr:putative toxin-antitoxin system toxin component, PIN family [Thermomicrobiales bacterium]MCO5223118.1 putative toxin-antitoxin system toxin component, PIN family [Thermomicrobiales bacterium]
MRVLLDTNALAASIVGANLGWTTPPAQIWRRWQQKQFTLLISEHVMAELNTTLERPWFLARLDPPARDLAIRDLGAIAEVVELVVRTTGVTSHMEDDLVLSAAVSGNADYLVTGDAEFRRVGEYQGVKLRTPAEFLRELGT